MGDMAKILIGFSKPNCFKPLACLIMAWQKTPFSHVYLKLIRKSGVNVIYQASGHAVNFMGCKIFEKKALVIKEFSFEVSDDAKDKFLDWAIANSGADYSVLKGLGIFFARCFQMKNPFEKKDGYVCSILVAKALGPLMDKEIPDASILGPKEIYELCERLSVNNSK